MSLASKYLADMNLSLDDVRRFGGRYYKKTMECRIPKKNFWCEIERRKIRSIVLSVKKGDATEWLLYPTPLAAVATATAHNADSHKIEETVSIIPIEIQADLFQQPTNVETSGGVRDACTQTTHTTTRPVSHNASTQTTTIPIHVQGVYRFDKPAAMTELARKLFS